MEKITVELTYEEIVKIVALYEALQEIHPHVVNDPILKQGILKINNAYLNG